MHQQLCVYRKFYMPGVSVTYSQAGTNHFWTRPLLTVWMIWSTTLGSESWSDVSFLVRYKGWD
jgi:hypothetical protein